MTTISLPVKNTKETDIKLVRLSMLFIGFVSGVFLNMEGSVISCVTVIALFLILVICFKRFWLRKRQIKKLEMTENEFLVYGFSKEVLKIPMGELANISKALYLYVDFSGNHTYRYTLQLSNTYYFGKELVLGYKINEDKTPLAIEIMTSLMTGENVVSIKK